VRKLDWVILALLGFSLFAHYCLFNFENWATTTIGQIAQIVQTNTQTLRIEQDNWLRLSDRAEEILKNYQDIEELEKEASELRIVTGVLSNRLDRLDPKDSDGPGE